MHPAMLSARTTAVAAVSWSKDAVAQAAALLLKLLLRLAAGDKHA
jgi:hypothetical protein